MNSLINDCLNIEYDIIKLNDINQRKYNSLNNSIIFSPEETEINQFIQSIKNYGDLIKNMHNSFDSKLI